MESVAGSDIFVQFAVQDTGLGLNPEEQKVLFKRFSQATPRTHVQYGGSGLGLFISKTLVEKQGGEIGVSSELGIGSTFAFYIWTKRVFPNASTRPFSMDSPGFGPETERASFPRETLKVLIVEDNITNQKVMSRQLQQQGCVVYIANHGGEAISMLENSTRKQGLEKTGMEISVVLMDQQMPIMDGATCVQIIREMERDGRLVSHVPVIGVTANARTQQVEDLKSAGMVGYNRSQNCTKNVLLTFICRMMCC
jgi:CheY-like chemotaxis protein